MQKQRDRVDGAECVRLNDRQNTSLTNPTNVAYGVCVCRPEVKGKYAHISGKAGEDPQPTIQESRFRQRGEAKVWVQ